MIGLTGGNVTDESFAHFVRFPTLNALNLDRTHITNEGLAHLGRLPEMYLLRLNGTVITDDGLKHLVGLKKMAHLEGLRGLKGISLDGTRVTKAMVAKIKARPTVYWITGGR